MARSYARRGAHRMTPARRAALRKAQAESARRRKRNKRIKIAAGVTAGVAGLGTAAYLGYKHGDKAGNIAKDMKARTPKNVGAAMGRVRSAVQIDRKLAVLRKSGVTKGVVNGAGPDAGRNKPRRWKITKLPDTTLEEAQALQDAAMGIVRETRKNGKGKEIVGTRRLGPADRQKYDEHDNIITKMRGIPVALVKGYKLRSNKYSAAIDKNQTEIAKLGVQSQSEAERRFGYRQAVRGSKNRAADPVRGSYRTEAQRDKAKASARKRRQTLRVRRAAKEQKFKNQVFDQWLKDFPNG